MQLYHSETHEKYNINELMLVSYLLNNENILNHKSGIQNPSMFM